MNDDNWPTDWKSEAAEPKQKHWRDMNPQELAEFEYSEWQEGQRRQAKYRAAEVDAQIQREQERWQRLRQEARIPARYKEASVADWVGHKPFALLLDRMDPPRAIAKRQNNMVLTGPPGTGKTHAAITVGKAWDICLISWRYYTFDGLVRELKATWEKGATGNEAAIVNEFASHGLAVLDDVGAGTKASEFNLNLAFALIDARYAKALPTLVVSNLDAKELAKAIGQRAFDRLRDGELINFPGPSRRGAK